MSSNSPSGGMNEIVRSFSNLESRTHWWNLTSSSSTALLLAPANDKIKKPTESTGTRTSQDQGKRTHCIHSNCHLVASIHGFHTLSKTLVSCKSTLVQSIISYQNKKYFWWKKNSFLFHSGKRLKNQTAEVTIQRFHWTCPYCQWQYGSPLQVW